MEHRFAFNENNAIANNETRGTYTRYMYNNNQLLISVVCE